MSNPRLTRPGAADAAVPTAVVPSRVARHARRGSDVQCAWAVWGDTLAAASLTPRRMLAGSLFLAAATGAFVGGGVMSPAEAAAAGQEQAGNVRVADDAQDDAQDDGRDDEVQDGSERAGGGETGGGGDKASRNAQGADDLGGDTLQRAGMFRELPDSWKNGLDPQFQQYNAQFELTDEQILAEPGIAQLIDGWA